MLRLQARDRLRSEKGFTLIELMVVVLIIGILIAIALPTYLGSRQRAYDKQAQQSARNVLGGAKACYTDSASYTPCDATSLAAEEVSVSIVSTASTGPSVVSVVPGGSQVIYIAVWSRSGTCFAIRDDVTAGNATKFAIAGTVQANCASGDAAVTGAAYADTW